MAHRKLKISEITVDPELQVRVQEPDHAEYEEDFRKQKGFGKYPPLDIVQVGEEFLLVGGFTRYRAARAANLSLVPCNVEKGTRKDAITAACGSNADHGFRRTPSDKRRAVEIALRELPDANPTQIAKICQVSRTTVYSIKDANRSVEPSGNGSAKKNGKPEKGGEASPPKSGLNIPCPVCSQINWEERDSGYVCRDCKHVYGEETGGTGDESDESTQSSNEAHDQAVMENLKSARSAYGKLLRALEAVGICSPEGRGKEDKWMANLHAAIEKRILDTQGKK